MLLVSWAQAVLPVADVVNQVSQSNYQHYLDDMLYTHLGDNRGLAGPQHDLARANIYSHFTSLGLTTSLDCGADSGCNVVAVKLGTVRPQDIYIISGHYDSADCPGAVDDASGVAAVMEAARVLALYPSEATITFIAFDAEEKGGLGSHFYADRHQGDHILGMASLDMIGYHLASDNSVDICSGVANPMQTELASAVSLYGQGMAPNVKVQSLGSDHQSFEAFTDACLLIQPQWGPYFHTANDSVDMPNYIDHAYATNITRSVVGYLATKAVAALKPGDINGDGYVDTADVLIMAGSFGASTGEATYNPRADFNDDGRVDVSDLLILAAHFAAPMPGDANGDGHVDASDLLLLASAFGSVLGGPGYAAACDSSGDGRVDISDLLILAGKWGR